MSDQAILVRGTAGFIGFHAARHRQNAGRTPARIYKVGNHHPEELTHMVALLKKELGRPAVKDMLPIHPGDVMQTFADVGDPMRDVGFRPKTSIEDGIHDFVAWYGRRPLQSLRARWTDE